MKKIIQLGLAILLTGIFASCSGRMTLEQMNQITSGEHGFLVFTFPVVGTRGWGCEVYVDEKKYFSSVFLEGESYKVPIPTGQHRIRYKIFSQKGIFIRTHYLSGVDSGSFLYAHNLTGNYSGMEIEVKKDQVISINIQAADEERLSILNTILQLGIPTWSQRMEAKAEIEKDVVAEKKIPKPFIIGKVFSVNGEKIEIMRGQSELKPGNMLYIFNKNKVIGKLVVAQVYHTKASGKIITSQGEIQKDMEYGRMN